MDALKQKLTYANVVATLALIVAVAGIPTAVAVTKVKVKKNSITSKQIKNGAIRASDLAPGAVTSAKLADGGVTASKLARIRQVTAHRADNGSVIAQCAAAERLISGGGGSPTGSFFVTAPVLDLQGGGAWEVDAGGSTSAYALCLSAAPGG